MPPSVLFLCLPDIDKPIGGVKQLYRQAEHLISNGINAIILTESDNFRPTWFETHAATASSRSILVDNSSDYRADNTILVLPETYNSINLKSYRGLNLSNFRYVIFNQNVYYSFNGLLAEAAKLIHGLSFTQYATCRLRIIR